MAPIDEPGSLERCVAKSEIESLLHQYAVAAREECDVVRITSVFHANGIFRLPNGVAIKPRDLLEVAQGKPPKFVRHHLTSIDIDFITATEAQTQTYFFAITDMSSLDHWGQYKDVVTKDHHGKWLIADRTICIEGSDPKGWYKFAYPG